MPNSRPTEPLIEVRYRRGLHLPEPDLWLDSKDARPLAFVSHAHSDHFARHQRVICSEGTAHLLRVRYGIAAEKLIPLPYHQSLDHSGFRLRLLPAGHITGSAMLHLTRLADGASLLYTGDFKLRRNRTAEPAVLVHADLLVMETTFGLPRYAFPPAMEIEASILRFVHDTLADGETPVLLGYPLGKAQEVLALLAEHGIPCVQHPNVAEMTRACAAAGARLPEPIVWNGEVPRGHVVVAAHNALHGKALQSLGKIRTAFLTGWAMSPRAEHLHRVNEAIPLSDHADHPALWETIQRVRPKQVITMHGFAREFAAELRARGIEAWSATGGDQLELGVAMPSGAASPAGAGGRLRHPRPVCAFADFSDVCRLVAETTSRIEKTARIANYLTNLGSGDELRLACDWLTGRAVPHGAGSFRQAGSATLRRALLALPGARPQRLRQLTLAHRDDTGRVGRQMLEECNLKPLATDLAAIDAFCRRLGETGASLARIEALAGVLRNLHPAEGETLLKLLAGNLAIGVDDELVEEAIARAFKADPARVCRTRMFTGSMGEAAVLARDKRLTEPELHPLYPLELVGEVAGVDASAIRFPASGEPLWLQADPAGIRAQLHKQGERAAIFAADGSPLDAEFPEIPAAAAGLKDDFILDGQLVLRLDGKPLRLSELRQHKRHRAAQGDLFRHPPPAAAAGACFVAFDLLWHNGHPLLHRPLHERRAWLESLTLTDRLAVAPLLRAGSPEVLGTLCRQTREAGHTGLLVQDPEASYHPRGQGSARIGL